MTLSTACTFAAKHDNRIGVLLRNGKPMFYFISRAGIRIEAHDGPSIRAILADDDRSAL